MKIIINNIPAKHGEKPFSAIRLYPENNNEITEMEWALKVFKNKAKIEKIICGGYHYAIILEPAD